MSLPALRGRDPMSVRGTLAVHAPLVVAFVLPLAWGATTEAAAQSFPPLLPQERVAEVRVALESMKAGDRGPYLRIRWFCADGSTHPAPGTPCRERGGGVQHAEPSDAALWLAGLHFHVGTILQATTFDEVFDAGNAGYRLRELVLERYLVDVDDGWVLRKARFYRGARQIEDEETRGQEILEQLLSRTGWTGGNFLLASHLVATVPHPGAGGVSETHRVRNLATEVADLDPGFLRTRIKIHSFPSRNDLDAVTAYLDGGQHTPEVRAKLEQLREALGRQYDSRAGSAELARFERRFRSELGPGIAAIRRSYEAGEAAETLARIATFASDLRARVEGSGNGRENLALLDLNLILLEQAFVVGQELAGRSDPLSRVARLRRASQYLDLAYAGGLLSGREREALQTTIRNLEEAPTVTALQYRTAIAYLNRSLDWSWSTARSVFAPVQRRYLQVEPAAAGFVDAVVRGSTLLPLSAELGRLSADADGLMGASHEILGTSVSQGVRGVNPGLAVGRLSVLEPDNLESAEAKGIYVLPVTPPELKPVAGVLTMDEGNLLSHVQLLARNLGIPNAAVAPSLLPRIRTAEGSEVLYAVSPLGRVVLEPSDRLSETSRALLDEGHPVQAERVVLDVSRLRLDQWRPVLLDRLRVRDSGVIVGPKAANLGQLASFFPEHVSRGVALPFGMFRRHVDRPYRSDRTVLEELQMAYREAGRMRAGGSSEVEIDTFMLAALERTRTAIQELEWIPEVREAVVQAIDDTFGDDLGRGVFIRSDTNVEDLPQFSGAGLNLTVANKLTLDDVLAAVKRVWTSPFSERAYLWRKQILEEQGQVYPSVLVLESVPSERSGVLITSGLDVGGPSDLTVVTAEGVGGGVEGEEAETVVVDPAGRIRLLSQTKAPSRRTLVGTGSGGVTMVAAARPDTLLTRGDIEELRRIVARWKSRFHGEEAGQVWDVEFGFVGDKLWLFQIRPFVRFRNSGLLERLHALDRDVVSNGGRRITLSERI